MSDARNDADDTRVGTVVGKYRIVSLIGRGGMGTVYEARHVELPKKFAVKFMLPEYAANQSTLHRFENEARAAASLDHPNIATVFDIGRAQDGAPYLVMAFLSGQDASQLLVQMRQLPVARAANIVFQACLGLAVAHEADIIHRDIKPENLYVTDAGDGSDLVKILDFGIAKFRSPDGSVATATGTTMGTYFYMSPEQIRNSAAVDKRTDVWALGVVLYELLTGKKPFNGNEATQIMFQIVHETPAPLAELRSELDPGLIAVLERALQKDADKRWPSVLALALALAPYTGRPSVQPGREAVASGNATQTSAQSVPNAVGSMPHVSISTLPEKPPSLWTMVRTQSRRLIWAGVVLVGLIGMLWGLVPRTNGYSQQDVMPTEASVRSPNSAASDRVAASQSPKAILSATQASTPVPTGSAAAASTSNTVRTSSEGLDSGSDAPRVAIPAKPVLRLQEKIELHRSTNAHASPTNSAEAPARRTRDPIGIDVETPY